MADTVDGLKGRSHVNTVAAETVEVRTSGEDVRMVVKGLSKSLSERLLELKSAGDLIVALVLVGVASRIIAAVASAVVLVAGLDAITIAIALSVAGLADTHELVVGHDHVSDLSDHVINAEADLALLLEDAEVLLSGLTLIVVLGKSVRDEVLRDSSWISCHLLGATTVRSAEVDVLHEAKEGVSLEAEVTVLARDGLRVLISIVIRILKDGAEVSVHAVGVDGSDPTMRPAGSDISAELGILKASIRRGVSRSRGCNVDVLRELLLVEHGARVAGGHEEDELLEHLLGLHGLKAGGEIALAEELVSGHGNDTRATVIIVEDENVIVLGRLEGLARASTSGIARKNIDKVLDGSILGDVILHDILINVDVLASLVVEIVEDLTRERILSIVGDIILEESDDALVRDTSLVSKLISLAHGGLVTIVAPASGTSDQNNPGLATLSLTELNGLLEHIMLHMGKCKCNKSESNKESLHSYILQQQ